MAKRFIILALTCALALAVFTMTVAAASVTLRFVINHGAEDGKLFQVVVDKFNEAHPDIEVQLQNIPAGGDDYYQKLTVMAASDTLPDIFYMRGGSGDMKYYKQGFAADISSLVERDREEIDFDDFIEAQLTELRYNGKFRALPYDYSTMGLYYNKDLFHEAGVGYPTSDWTWSDVLQAAKKLTKKAGRRTIQLGLAQNPAIDGAHPWLEGMLMTEGARLFNEDYTKSLLDDPKTVAVMRSWAEMTTEHEVAPYPGQMGNENVYFTGRAAMTIDGSWATMGHRALAGFSFDVAMLPQGLDGHRVASATGGSWAINRTTKHLQEAWEFVKYLTSKEASRILIVEPIRSLPSRKSLLPEWFARIASGGLDPQNARVFGDQVVQYGRNSPTVIADYIFVLQNKLPLLVDQPADQVLKEAAAEINKLLREEQNQ